MSQDSCPMCGASLPEVEPAGGGSRCPACKIAFDPLDGDRLTLLSRCTEGVPTTAGAICLNEGFLKRFRIERTLGIGAMGMVVSATNLESGQLVAVKFMKRLGDPGLLARFVREGRLMSELRHPNLVEVWEVGEIEGHPYFVCEYLQGGSLREKLLKEGRMAWSVAVRIMLDVLAGLEVCHARGVVHRDLKPGNVLLTSDGRAKLADLGIAKDYGSAEPALTACGAVIGTPAYMAPEQLRGEPASVTSDLYAAGVMLYELIAGDPPFPFSNPVEVYERMEKEGPRPLRDLVDGVPDALAALVSRCLSRHLSERPQNAEEMVVHLRRVSGRPTGSLRRSGSYARTGSSPAATPAPVEVPRGFAVACVAGLLVGFLCLGALLLHWAYRPRKGRGPAEGSAGSPPAPGVPAEAAVLPGMSPTPDAPSPGQVPAPISGGEVVLAASGLKLTDGRPFRFDLGPVAAELTPPRGWEINWGSRSLSQSRQTSGSAGPRSIGRAFVVLSATPGTSDSVEALRRTHRESVAERQSKGEPIELEERTVNGRPGTLVIETAADGLGKLTWLCHGQGASTSFICCSPKWSFEEDRKVFLALLGTLRVESTSTDAR